MGIHGRSAGLRHIELKESGEQIIDFVRCSYLGLDVDHRLQQGAIEEIQRHKALHWSCARTRLNFVGISELEEELSYLFEARSIAFPTVTQGNQAILPLLAGGLLNERKPDLIVFDKKAHASLAYHKPILAQETNVTTINHNDMQALEDLCKQYSSVAFICDGVYSMGGEADFVKIKQLQHDYGLITYIDDAHGVSISGENGKGVARSYFSDLGENTIIATSLGKGFGASGGLVLFGTQKQEAIARKFSGPYAFSVGPNVAVIGACKASAKIHLSKEIIILQEELFSKLAFFDSMFSTDQRGSIIPIRMLKTDSAEQSIQIAESLLYQHNFYTSAVFFPTVAKSESGIRIAITALHAKEDIKRLYTAFTKLKSDTSEVVCG